MELFVWPLVFSVLPLPWLIAAFLKPVTKKSAEAAVIALRAPFFNDVSGLGIVRNRPMSRRSLFFLTLAWIAAVTAGARPVAYDEAAPVVQQARNLVIALDASGSMSARDLTQSGGPQTRLETVKRVVDHFIEKRAADRIALILFGSEAYVYAPLSSDGKTLRELLKDVDFGIAGEATALGDALALSVQQALSAPGKTRAVILLSDGFSNAGSVTPDQAAAVAARHNIPVYTIGLGADKQTIAGFFGPVTVDPAADLDEQTLNAVAAATGGAYFRAKSESDLEQVYAAIDALETDRAETAVRPRRELFFWPVSVALVCLALTLMYRERFV